VKGLARSQAALVAAAVLVIAASTAVYYVIPVPGKMHEGWWASIRGLLLLLTLTVLFFSWAVDSVAMQRGLFDDLQNKTDSLYFNISTLATVGFGDVHPVGQLARAAVTLQIIFNLVFIGAAISMISRFFRARAQGRLASQPGQTGQPAQSDAENAAEPEVPG
jgi:voltage-gated potassium channel